MVESVLFIFIFVIRVYHLTMVRFFDCLTFHDNCRTLVCTRRSGEILLEKFQKWNSMYFLPTFFKNCTFVSASLSIMASLSRPSGFTVSHGTHDERIKRLLQDISG